jgi:hypothetical protein
MVSTREEQAGSGLAPAAELSQASAAARSPPFLARLRQHQYALTSPPLSSRSSFGTRGSCALRACLVRVALRNTAWGYRGGGSGGDRSAFQV